MALDCFIGYVEILDFSINTPSVGARYINSQPGITQEMIQKIQEKEKDSTGTLWDTIQRRALVKFGDRYRAAMDNKYEFWCHGNEGCGTDKIACDNKELFASAWMYCLCSELMIERVFSTRMNRFTTIDAPEAEELKAYYDVEFEKALNSAVKHLPKDVLSKCVKQRTGRIYHHEELP